ncbi:alpha/beta fold hydrolase [Dactylosporangium sp. AC04546]|uniref:thioesterase II family protein n=1 Tax=Dactylosporangium sp. AC04546 TaxID=2862460 RepID=UPI001EE05C06|nr:alpha/beta fold hydrolase [Dactylosporangium sp. AC04546]WVK88771.1 alpha/beta fold hydrolase [Dactylosporangium sp. AC04546]
MTLRLVCFPHAGGSGRQFLRWRDTLPGGVTVEPMDVPGRGRFARRPAAPTLREAARALLPDVTGAGAGRYALLGHSMGALLAYEIARLAADGGEPGPQFLVVAGCRPPHDLSTAWHAELSALPDDDLLAVLAAGGQIPDGLRTSPMRSLFVPGLRADLRLVAGYRPPPRPGPLAVPLLAWCGDADPVAPAAAAEGWRGYTAAGFTLTRLAGGHFFLHENPADATAALRRHLCPSPS